MESAVLPGGVADASAADSLACAAKLAAGWRFLLCLLLLALAVEPGTAAADGADRRAWNESITSAASSCRGAAVSAATAADA